MKIRLFILLLFTSVLCRSQNVVINYSDCRDVDKAALTILDEIFRYDNITIKIYNLEVEENTIILAKIDKDSTALHSYIIHLNYESLYSSAERIKTIAHELAHLRQYESGELIELKNKNGVVFRGDTINYDIVGYSLRPHEIDAIERGSIIEKDLGNM
jgi:hypothetical protein